MVHTEAAADRARPLLLDVRGLTKVFGEGDHAVRALDAVDLQLLGGQICGLLGPNGAGKTTFLRICATLLRPTAGTARVAGKDTVTEARDVRRLLGYLSATTGSYERLTPREQMAYFGALHGLSPAEVSSRTELLFDRLGLSPYQDRTVGKLSTGNRQKVSIARAFLHDPPVLILDEPTNGLDVLVRESLLEILEDSIREDRLILLSTHDLAEAEDLCASFAFIHEGRIVAQGSRAELLHDERLRTVFFREVEVTPDAP